MDFHLFESVEDDQLIEVKKNIKHLCVLNFFFETFRKNVCNFKVLSANAVPLRGGPLSAFVSLCLRFLLGSCFFADVVPMDRLLKLFGILRGPGGFIMHVDTKS